MAKKTLDDILRSDRKDGESFDDWIQSAEGTAQEALCAAENMMNRAIPSVTNWEDYRIVRKALWRLKVLDRKATENKS